MKANQRGKHEEQLFERLQSIVEELGCVLIDVKLRNENKKRFLRLFVDKVGGINLDDLELVSKTLDPILEEWGEDSHDFFEVQSPGLDKPLQSTVEFALRIGEDIELSLYQKLDGQKKFAAKLLTVNDDGISVELENEQVLELNYDDIAQAKRVIRF